ncbi:MAG: hypothetical protein A2X12_12200 [Bacteroidetes bacterium GWE2_29_8]|nr:MAG: hypothetical protein A2X12_12200 [Bacteroidetes bacterium GWE2_29_8]OFY21328.1 MAG: hypothetical protein A2X02_05220 [Bacteroidetes bacterium GWF2_29_10]
MFCKTNIYSQELYCNVQVVAQQIQTTEKRVFETMQNAITEFINARNWTNYSYTVDERIECSILINITDRPSHESFKGTIQIQAKRPVYNSSYSTMLLNHIDKDFTFNYAENQSLDFSENANLSNLTSTIAFYAYIIIGLDFDSFSPLGGESFFTKAQNIVNLAQSSSDAGWKAYENNKNRYWVCENLLNPIFKPLRQASYSYHRQGLDIMYDKLEPGRNKILEALELLPKVNREKPGSILMQQFFNAKSDEIVSIFSKATPQDKSRILKVVNEIDPSNASKYKTITDSK